MDSVNIDGNEFEMLAQFPGFFTGLSTIPRSNGAVKLGLGVPREGRSDVLDLADTSGETLLFVAFRRVITTDDTYETDGD